MSSARHIAKMERVLVTLVLVCGAALATWVDPAHAHYFPPRAKRILPYNNKCGGKAGTRCEKGDLVDNSVADCNYDWSWSEARWTCTASDPTGGMISWVVDEERDGKCNPVVKGKKFRCGDPGTNTRCVCNDYKFRPNTCRCQYWTRETPGENEPAFCTGYYLGGSTTVHHFVCCNNCLEGEDSSSKQAVESPCDRRTYQGGSDGDYCGSCGVMKDWGEKKYFFNCGGCETQTKCEKKCDTKWLGLYGTSGLCWLWVNCFKKCCVSSVRLSQRHRRSVP